MKTLKSISSPWTRLTLLSMALGLWITAMQELKAQDAAATPAWMDAGIGATGTFQTNQSGTFIVVDTGVDLWGTNDAFHYVYQRLSGTGEIVARVLAINSTNDWAKAGVMIRETLDGGARNVMKFMTLGHDARFEWRAAAGGETELGFDDINAPMPCWLKLVRNGDWIGGYISTDGINWTLTDSVYLNGLAPTVYVGLAWCNHSPQGSWGTAAFDQVSVSTVAAAQVVPPKGTGDGLAAEFFGNRHLWGQPTAKWIDLEINLSQESLWAQGIPATNEFSIRWSGEVEAQFSEPYVFYGMSDDGMRLWLNGQLIIDDWKTHASEEVASAPINLVAGQHYLLRVEYFQAFSAAQATLSWSSASTPKHIVPESQLYSQPVDSDTNGLPDIWEMRYFSRIGVDPNGDPDGDGLLNLQEYHRHTDPTNPLNRGLPNEWTGGNIEDFGNGDSVTTYSNGVFTLNINCTNGSQHIQYLYQGIGTNSEMVVRVLGVSGIGTSIGGIMLRESLDSAARNIGTVMTPSNGMAFPMRDAVGGITIANSQGTKQLAPYWLKVVRSCDWVAGYMSPDGTNWTLLDWEFLSGLRPQVFIGLAALCQNTNLPPAAPAASTSVQFDHVYLGPVNPADVLSPVEGNGDGLMANYRGDSLLYLPGVTNRVEKTENYYFVHGPPFAFLDPDGYGVSWSGEVQAQLTEAYQFSVQTRREDWVRVWVNEQLVMDGWRTWHSDYKVYSNPINLVAGQRYLIRVEMYDNLGQGVAILRWKSPTTPEHVISQSQLYSQPVDSDGNGLPDNWQTFYFGHIGINPNADPDGDGLSNLQEYKSHTNPTKADTDADGIPDNWEIAHGLDPQFNDAALDYDHSGWNNLQKYLYGLDPSNPDVNSDGLPDLFEVSYLGLNLSSSHADLTFVAASVTGSRATNYLGNWQVDGTDIYAMDRRGGLDFNLTVSSADKYVLNLVGTQNSYNPMEVKFKLLLSIDSQTLGHYTLTAGYGTNGQVELVLPYLNAGAHTVHVFWDGVAGFSSLRIKELKLLAIAGADANQNGIKDWADKMIATESGVDATDAVVGSYTSPTCLEGRDPYSAMMFCTNNQTNALSPTATTDGRWYVNVPLQAATQTVFQANYQNGALAQTRRMQWLAVNLITSSNGLTIRQGDSLLFSALPPGRSAGTAQITVDTNSFSGNAAKPVPFRFTKAGVYTVAATYTAPGGATQSGSVTVAVVQQNLPNVQPAAWTWMQRNVVLPSLAPETSLQSDSRLSCTIVGTNSSGQTGLSLATGVNEPLSLIARLGTNGPIMDSVQVLGFDLWSGDQTQTRVIQVYPDGSQLVEMPIVVSPLSSSVTYVLDIIVSGVIFDDGTTQKTLTPADFDALGQTVIRFIRPVTVRTSICNSIRAYQGVYQLGYRH
jgi:hypothetical protein